MPVTCRGQNQIGVDRQRQRRPSVQEMNSGQHFSTPTSDNSRRGGGGLYDGSGGGGGCREGDALMGTFYYMDPFSRPDYHGLKFQDFYI